MEALNKVIPFVPNKNKDNHKVAFLKNYFVCAYGIKKEKLPSSLIDKYKNECNTYYKDVMKSKEIDLKTKVKMSGICKCPSLYYFAKDVKNNIKKN